jgi:muconolactone D-isomerase
MLFKVEMVVNIPATLDKEQADELKAREKKYSQDLQHSGKWRHIWRIAGKYENVSIFDVKDNTELHEILIGLPLYPYMTMSIQALCRHPSSIHENDY